MNKLVIFDCDGVLVDSEHLASQAFVDCLAELKIIMNVDEIHKRFLGRKLADCLKEIEQINNYKLPTAFETTFRQRMSNYFESKLQAVPGVMEAIEEIPYPKCVASNGPHQKIKRNLEITKLAPYFGENIFSAYTIQKWKPDPALFLHACKTMGFTPNNSIVIEDSDSGIAAALAGGFRVLAFGDKFLAEKNIIPFQSMRELPQLVNNILSK